MPSIGWFAALASLLLSPALFAEDPVEVPFRVERQHASILIKVEVANKERTFLVDTGSTWTVLDRKLLGITKGDILKSRLERSSPGFVIDGIKVKMPLRLGTHRWEEAIVLVTDLDPVTEAYGEVIDGVLGQDIMLQFGRITIDYSRNVLILAPR